MRLSEKKGGGNGGQWTRVETKGIKLWDCYLKVGKYPSNNLGGLSTILSRLYENARERSVTVSKGGLIKKRKKNP